MTETSVLFLYTCVTLVGCVLSCRVVRKAGKLISDLLPASGLLNVSKRTVVCAVSLARFRSSVELVGCVFDVQFSSGVVGCEVAVIKVGVVVFCVPLIVLASVALNTESIDVL